MKHAKTLVVVLSGLLLLSSCAPAAVTPVESPPVESPPVWSAPIETPSAPSPEPTPERLPPVVEIKPLEPFRLDEKFTRYYPETVLEIIPRDDYGPIYPYIGGVSLNHWEDYDNVYGFCTAGGQIICDSNYKGVALYEYEGERVYTARKTTGQVVTEGWSEPERNTMYLIASDGRFALEFESVQPGGEGTFAVKKDGKWGSVDYRGREVLPCEYEHPVTFSDGLAVVTNDFEAEYHYVDKEGSTVLGPYPAIPREVAGGAWEMGDNWGYRATLGFADFHDGRAAFYQDGNYGFIDKTGAQVIPARYTASWQQAQFKNGRAIVSAQLSGNRWQYALIDTDGNEIVPMSFVNISLERDNDDGMYLVYDEVRKSARLIDRDGNVMLGPYDYDDTFYHADRCGYIGDGWFYEYYGNDDTYALLRDGVVYDVGGPFSIQPIGEDRFYARYDEGAGRYIDKIIDSSGKVYYAGGPDMWLSFYDTLPGCALVYAYMPGYDTYTQIYGVIDRDGDEIIPMEYDHLEPIGDYYLVRDGIYGGLLNPAGDWVIKVSLLGTMED